MLIFFWDTQYNNIMMDMLLSLFICYEKVAILPASENAGVKKGLTSNRADILTNGPNKIIM